MYFAAKPSVGIGKQLMLMPKICKKSTGHMDNSQIWLAVRISFHHSKETCEAESENIEEEYCVLNIWI